MKTSFPKDKIRVVLVENIHPEGAAMLRKEGFSVETLSGAPDEAKLLKLVVDAHVLGIRSKTEVTQRVLDAAPRLLAVGAFCIGTNQIDLAAARKQGVPVFNSPFSNTRSVAELTIAEVIALYRRLTEKTVQMHAGVWDKSASGAHEVRGRTLGIVGYGHIGSQVSVLAEALGMRVLFYDIVPKMAMGNARAVKSLGELLKESDVVTLHVPATEATRGLIGAAQLKKMRAESYLINNSRGSVVDVSALSEALRSGHLAGAALDVFPDEPAHKDQPFHSPLRGLANVILTPHVGGSTEEAQATIADDVCTKLLKFVNVGSTTGAVNVPEVELPEQPGTQAMADEEVKAVPVQRPHRILHFHRNVPGVLSNMHRAIAEIGANISAEYLRTSEEVGYVVLDVDPTDGEQVLARLREIPETIRVRMLW
ncbi:MAG TPA: phosphoglycerate dehydrogenase [Phycisphaerales bacterium]|nr:phosphoglycerate dehydrogenase [Phycisphaerales bacterium]